MWLLFWILTGMPVTDRCDVTVTVNETKDNMITGFSYHNPFNGSVRLGDYRFDRHIWHVVARPDDQFEWPVYAERPLWKILRDRIWR